MAIGKRIDAATLTVQNETVKALQGILEHLDKAEREKLKKFPIPGFSTAMPLAVLTRLLPIKLPREPIGLILQKVRAQPLLK